METLTSQIAHTSQQNHSPTPQNRLITIKTRSTIHGKKEVTAPPPSIKKNESKITHRQLPETPSCPLSPFEQFLLSLLSLKLLEIPFSLTQLRSSLARSLITRFFLTSRAFKSSAHAFWSSQVLPLLTYCLALLCSAATIIFHSRLRSARDAAPSVYHFQFGTSFRSALIVGRNLARA